MKIGIIAPFSDKWSTIHGLTSGLEENGHEWVEIDIKIQFGRACKGGRFADTVAKMTADCDTLMIGKGTPIPMNVFRLLTEKCPDTTYLTFDSVSGDGCGPPNRPIELGPRGMACDRIILTGTEGARWYRANGYEGRIAQIYQGCRHEIWKPGKEPRQNQERLIFLGSKHYKGDGGRDTKLRQISKAGRTNGYVLSAQKRIYHEQAADMYWNSAICPNFVCGDITSNRVMRVLSSGGFCLTERNADIDHSFTDGEELATLSASNDVKNVKEWVDRIRYFMARPALRHEIAMRGHEWTRDKSWAHQVEKMVQFIRGEDVPADGAAGEYVNQSSLH